MCKYYTPSESKYLVTWSLFCLYRIFLSKLFIYIDTLLISTIKNGSLWDLLNVCLLIYVI